MALIKLRGIKMFYRIQNAFSERHIDDNGYMNVYKSPILRTGVLEYYGSELLPQDENGNFTEDSVDGVKIDKDKIYKVFISEEELRKSADSFRLLPITDDHTWLGDEGEDAKDFQQGSTGENAYVEDGFLYVPLKLTGKEIVEEVDNHEKEELSASYYNRFIKSDNPDYDFMAVDIKGNHLALVDKGRCGSAVRVLNSIKEKKEMANKAKVHNEAILKLDGKEINLDQFFKEEADEKDDGADVHEDSISENEDKRSIIDEIGGILKDKVDEEVWRTIVGKMEKLAYEGSEDSKADNACKSKNEEDDKEEDKEDKLKSENSMMIKIANAIRSENAKNEQEKVKAYNAASKVCGDFNAFGMSANDMYVKALNHLGVELDGKEKTAELSAMLKACSAVQSKVDNSFSYSSDSNELEEIEVNM